MKHKQTLRRGLGILLSLVLCLSLLPATALAEGTATATETADFITNATAALALLNDAKTGTADSTWADNTLTLKGVNFTTTAETAVKLPDGATIVLADGTENTIASTADNAYMSYGIYATNGLTIEGSGTLTVRSAKATTNLSNSVSYGIYADAGDITISGGTVTATGGEAEYSSGIYADAGDITISGGTVTATGGEAEYSSGIDADGVTISGGTVTATGGKAATNSRGIDAHTNVTISGGTVTATGGETTHDSWGSNGIDADGVTISGGTVTATGGKAAANSCGIYAYTNVTITGGTLTVTAGTAEQISCGIYGYTNVTITGGTVTATGGEAEYSCGIDSDGVTISGGTVTATGGKAATNSYGIYAINNVTISGGHVTAQTVSTTATTESALNVAPDLSSYTGYRWRTSASGDFTSSADTAYTYRESDTYVEFSQGAAPTTYTVRFDANGGSGEMTDVTDVSGSFTLPACTFTPPEGKQFAGWATSADGEVITGTITVTENTTLYAVWEDISDTTCDETADFTTDAEAALALLNAAKTEGAADSTWNSESKILTLKGVDFTTSAATAVILPDGATIELADGTENTIANVHGLIGISVGIQANGNITIQGSGTLTVTAGTAAQISCGIYSSDGNVTIKGGTVNATGGTAEYSCGIYADGMTISGGTVTATGGETTEVSLGSYGIYSPDGNVTISGGTVTATGGETTEASWGSYGIDADGVTISGGTVTATGGTAEYSYGIDADGVTISGGTVTATGGEATGEESESYGICAYGDMDISGGTVTATGGNATGDASKSSGLYGRGYFENNEVIGGNITISGGTVKATGGNVDLYSDGIYADGAVTISGGTVTATGGEVTDEASESFGIESYVSETIIISGGHVTARTLTTTAWTKSALNAAPDLSGYSGYQWRTSASGDFTSSADTAYTYRESDTYVEFSQGAASTTYTVSFDANGGSGEMTDVTDVSGSYTLPTTTTFTPPEGKQFAGWATSADGEVITGTITVTENTTLYAVWEDIPAETKYTVTAYGLYGGVMLIQPGETYIRSYTAGEWVGLQVGIRDGYKLKGVTLEGITDADLTWAGKESETFDSRGFSFYMPENDVIVTVIWERIGGSGSGGSGGGVSTYAVTVDSAKNGTVTASAKTASKGATVTLTVTPDKGYTLETLTVTDASGKEVKLTEKNGKYTFTMPAGKVTVKVTFMEDNSMLNFFVDVPAGAYYYDAVLWAAKNGITGGVDDTHFAPDAPCTRAQIVTFLWRAAGSPEPESVSSFADVPADSYYAKAVAWAVENGITTGTGDGMFSPNATCTRAQAMAFIWRSQKSVAADGVNPFTDVAADAYYADAVLWAVENDVTNGTSDTTFSPNANCTRAQIVTFLYRCLGEE